MSKRLEAAVKAWDHYWGDRYGDEALEEMGEEVRIVLEAAAPFIAAKALEDAADGWSDWDALQAPEDWLRARAAAVRS